MPRPVTFVDTSVLCNLLQVPHMDQEREAVSAELVRRRKEVRDGQMARATAVLSSRTPLLRGWCWARSWTMLRIAGRSRTSPGLAR